MVRGIWIGTIILIVLAVGTAITVRAIHGPLVVTENSSEYYQIQTHSDEWMECRIAIQAGEVKGISCALLPDSVVYQRQIRKKLNSY